MEFINHLKAIYHNGFFEVAQHRGTINEEEKGAFVNEVALNCNSDMLLINKNIFDTTNRLFIEKGKSPTIELAHGCDGAVMTKNGDSLYLFFVELKSNFTRNSVEKACKQFIASYIKLTMYLELVQELNIKQFKVGAILVSKPMSDEDKTNYLKRSRSLSEDKRSYDKVCLDLNSKRTVALDRSKSLNGIPIKESLVFEKLPIIHIPTSDKSTSIDLKDYFSFVD